MDANHRDRIAFVRLCSGTFKRGMKLQERALRQGPGGLQPDVLLRPRSRTGRGGGGRRHRRHPQPRHAVSVGDTLTEGATIKVTGIPNFAPEIIRRVRLTDPMKTKQLAKALSDLAEEGVAQVFRRMVGADWIVGVVGQLQLEVLQARILKEYNVPITFESLNFEMARWIGSDDKKELDRFISRQEDGDGRGQVRRPGLPGADRPGGCSARSGTGRRSSSLRPRNGISARPAFAPSACPAMSRNKGVDHEQRKLGKTGYEVSEIGLGTWQLGESFGPVSDETAEAILKTARSARGQFLGYGRRLWRRPVGEPDRRVQGQEGRASSRPSSGATATLFPNNYTRKNDQGEPHRLAEAARRRDARSGAAPPRPDRRCWRTARSSTSWTTCATRD